MKIPFHKPHITQEELDSVCNVIQSGWLTMGLKTIEFEKAFNQSINTSYSISVNSGTAALHLSLNAVGVGQNDEVIIPTNTFVATAEAILYSGAKPILCDIEERNHNINVGLIEKLISPKTKAIIPVHFGGHPCEMDEIWKLAQKYNLKVIEDAAHALPAEYKHEKIGTQSDVVCFSFYATKTMTTGEGGMITTNDTKIAEKVTFQRLHGISGDAWNRYENNNDWYYEVVDLGYKYNTTDIQSALGLIQLKKLTWMYTERQKIAEKYSRAFNGKLEYIHESPDCTTSWHLFVIKVANRDELHQKLKLKGIHTSVHFIPIHKHQYYRDKYSYKNDDYPIANNIYKQSISLPIYPSLQDQEIKYIIHNVLQYAKNN